MSIHVALEMRYSLMHWFLPMYLVLCCKVKIKLETSYIVKSSSLLGMLLILEQMSFITGDYTYFSFPPLYVNMSKFPPVELALNQSLPLTMNIYILNLFFFFWFIETGILCGFARLSWNYLL